MSIELALRCTNPLSSSHSNTAATSPMTTSAPPTRTRSPALPFAVVLEPGAAAVFEPDPPEPPDVTEEPPAAPAVFEPLEPADADEPPELAEAPPAGGLPPVARDWNAANDLAEFGSALTEKTMPAAQWSAGIVCAQKNQSGVVTFTVKLNEGVIPAGAAATSWKPESIPALTHGVGKVDCVTEWFLLSNVKITLSPMVTLVMLDGVKVSPLLAPTWTLKSAA